MPVGVLPRLEMVADEDRVEPDLLGETREIEQIGRAELLGRGLVSEFQHLSLLSDFRQHVLAEAAHVVDDRIGRIAAEAEIDGDDAEIAQRPQIGGNRRVVTGAEPALAVVGALRDARSELREAVGELEIVDVAAGSLRHVRAAWSIGH